MKHEPCRGRLARFIVAVVFAIALMVVAPGAASAALSLQIGPQSNPATPDAIVGLPLPTGRQFFDLTFTETGPPDNEGLFSYDLALRLVRPAGATGGVSLAGAEKPADNFVLDVPGGSTFSVAESDADHLLINVYSDNENQLADITTGKKAARIFYTFDPTAPCPIGDYRIVFDIGSTLFGSGDPNRPEQIEVNLTDAGVIHCVPEPGGLALLGCAALFGLRRRTRRCARLRP